MYLLMKMNHVLMKMNHVLTMMRMMTMRMSMRIMMMRMMMIAMMIAMIYLVIMIIMIINLVITIINQVKNDNKDNKQGNKDNKQGNKDNDNKPVNNDNKEFRQMNFAISLRKRFLNNITKIIELVNELNDEIHNDDQWLVFAQLNKINPLVDELIDRVWLMIYNKKREKNEIINIGVDKDKDIEGYVNIYNEIVADKIEFVNGISELFGNAIEKKEFRNLKDDVLKLIGNSRICDVKRKDCKKNNKEKDSDVKRKDCKKDSNKEKDSDDSKNVNNNDDNNDNDNDNLNDKLLNNKDKLHNLSDKVLNNLFIITKLKEKILINNEKIREIFNKINIPKKDIRSKLDKYKKMNILSDDLINHVWRIIYGKNRVNNEIDNIVCDEDERYTGKYIKIVNDKLVLIYAVSESVDELMEGLDVDTSNDIVAKKIKDFKRVIIKSIDKFNS